MHAERLPCTAGLPSLVLIAQVVFILDLEHTQTHKVTDATDHIIHVSTTVDVGNSYAILW